MVKLQIDYNQKGEKLYLECSYKLAAEYFARALAIEPNNAWFCQNLAEATARLSYKKGDLWTNEQLGNLLKKQGKATVVASTYRKALKLDPVKVEQHRKSQTFKINPPQKNQINNPIFILGCGHSGTSLMLAILGNHPQINPIPRESALYLKTDADIQLAMRDWDVECRNLGMTRWAEKTPSHIFQIHRLIAFRPNAKFIIMMRDGRDVVCSLKYRISSNSFKERLERWIYDNMAGMSWWCHPQVKVVKYESLIANTVDTLREICFFLELNYTELLLEYHKTERRWYSDDIQKPNTIETHNDHKNNRNWQINQPIFDGRERWKLEMSYDEKQKFKKSPAQNLLQRFGYVTDSNW